MAQFGNDSFAASAALMPVGEATELLLARVPCERAERVPLAEAEGWVLAQALAARTVAGQSAWRRKPLTKPCVSSPAPSV
jgi:hypothetical protein